MTNVQPDDDHTIGYLYWPVSGAAQFWREARSLAQAKAALAGLREKWPDVEIERVMLMNYGNGRRYWRWRDGEWSTDTYADPTPTDLANWLSPAPEITPSPQSENIPTEQNQPGI